MLPTGSWDVVYGHTRVLGEGPGWCPNFTLIRQNSQSRGGAEGGFYATWGVSQYW